MQADTKTEDIESAPRSRSRAALLVGAGDAIGAAVARRFAIEGYKVCIARRDASAQPLVDDGGRRTRCRAYSVDTSRLRSGPV